MSIYSQTDSKAVMNSCWLLSVVLFTTYYAHTHTVPSIPDTLLKPAGLGTFFKNLISVFFLILKAKLSFYFSTIEG